MKDDMFAMLLVTPSEGSLHSSLTLGGNRTGYGLLLTGEFNRNDKRILDSCCDGIETKRNMY
jgi:hypothetical protein